MKFEWKSFKYMVSNLDDRELRKRVIENKNNLFITAAEVIFIEIAIKKGIKMFGKKSLATMIKELKKLIEGAVKGKQLVQGIRL